MLLLHFVQFHERGGGGGGGGDTSGGGSGGKGGGGGKGGKGEDLAKEAKQIHEKILQSFLEMQGHQVELIELHQVVSSPRGNFH